MTTETKPRMGPGPNVQEAMSRPGARSVFFFDGDFRTWPQVEHRARLNGAISSYVERSRWN